MAVRAAFQPVEEDGEPGPVADEVEVDEIAVGRLPALAAKGDGRRRKRVLIKIIGE